MVCPYRKKTTTSGSGTTREYFMDCYGTECPYFRAEQHLSGGLYIPGFCDRFIYEGAKEK